MSGIHAHATSAAPPIWSAPECSDDPVNIQISVHRRPADLAAVLAPQHNTAERSSESMRIASVLIGEPDEDVSNYHSHLLRCRVYEVFETWQVDLAKAMAPRVDLIICDLSPNSIGSDALDLMRWVRDDDLLRWTAVDGSSPRALGRPERERGRRLRGSDPERANSCSQDGFTKSSPSMTG